MQALSQCGHEALYTHAHVHVPVPVPVPVVPHAVQCSSVPVRPGSPTMAYPMFVGVGLFRFNGPWFWGRELPRYLENLFVIC